MSSSILINCVSVFATMYVLFSILREAISYPSLSGLGGEEGCPSGDIFVLCPPWHLITCSPGVPTIWSNTKHFDLFLTTCLHNQMGEREGRRRGDWVLHKGTLSSLFFFSCLSIFSLSKCHKQWPWGAPRFRRKFYVFWAMLVNGERIPRSVIYKYFTGNLAPRYRDLKDPTTRQNFDDTPGQIPKLILTLRRKRNLNVFKLNWTESELSRSWTGFLGRPSLALKELLDLGEAQSDT